MVPTRIPMMEGKSNEKALCTGVDRRGRNRLF